MIGAGGPPSVMQSSQGTISVTRTDLGKTNSGNLSQMQTQLYEAQRKHALGIPPNYQPERSRKDFEQQHQQQHQQQQHQQERLRAVQNDHMAVAYINAQAAWAKNMEEEKHRHAVAAAAQQQKQLQQYGKYPTIMQTQMQPQPPPSSKSQVGDRYKLKSETTVTPLSAYPYQQFYKDAKVCKMSKKQKPNIFNYLLILGSNKVRPWFAESAPLNV